MLIGRYSIAFRLSVTFMIGTIVDVFHFSENIPFCNDLLIKFNIISVIPSHAFFSHSALIPSSVSFLFSKFRTILSKSIRLITLNFSNLISSACSKLVVEICSETVSRILIRVLVALLQANLFLARR